jgi:16S rRNA (guanine527-N7)-methyltransferase
MTLRRTLIEGAGVFGIGLTEKQADACLVYLVELEKWNRKMSLTAVREEQEIIVKHFIDSFSFVRGFDPLPGARLLDMGSGAGFPALPLKIAFPDLQVTLVESVRKKATFLRHIIRTLGLKQVEVVDQRTEALPETYRSVYDVVTARAFASMKDALREGAPFLRTRGVLVLSRGPAESVSDKDVAAAGMAVENRLELSLPLLGDQRAIWVFRKKA